MKRIILSSLLLLFLISSTAYSQPFTAISSGVQGAGRSAIAWGDHDNDGDLDLLISGMLANGTYRSTLYDNDEGIFVMNNASMAGVKDGSVAWGDFDNDNDLDIILSGQTMENGDICLIYRNDEGIFTELDAGLPGVGYGEASWGDYDNDGDLDILVAGNWSVSLFENIEGVFLLKDNDFGQLNNARSAWGDFDNDGDQDILLIGDTGGGYLSDIFLNNEGIFSRANLDMTGVISGTADMIDFDNDGDLDISITGFDIYLEPLFLTYENLGDGTVALYENILEGIATSSVDWGDYDSDGDLDILMCGKTGSCGGAVSKIFFNQDGVFLMEPTAVMEGMIRSAAAWADYDNDGDLDIMLTGMTASEYPYAQLFRNDAHSNAYTTNAVPQAPESLESFVNGQSVILLWDKAIDTETPQDGLSYNIRIGLSSGRSELISPLADNSSGYRFVQALGNVNQQTSWTITGLAPGTYYWSVQAIDQAYAGSEFAPEGTFMIVATGVNEQQDGLMSGVFPNPAGDQIFLAADPPETLVISILNGSGREIMSKNVRPGEAIDISALPQGIYFLRALQGRDISVTKFIKR